MPESGAVAAVDSIIAMGDRVGTTTTEIWDEHFCEVSLFSPAEPIRSLLQGSIIALDIITHSNNISLLRRLCKCMPLWVAATTMTMIRLTVIIIKV
jgi:hypothetical protein